MSDRSNYTCVAWFKDIKVALDYAISDPYADLDFHVETVNLFGGSGLGVEDGKVYICKAEYGFESGCDRVVEKVTSSTVGEGYAVWQKNPTTPEWSDWYPYAYATKNRQYRITEDGSVETRMKNV